jgi:pimeloyl-ACP methyl ester carboxylesterase
MPKVKIDGADIYYEVHGQGEPLLLLHHGTGCTKMWEKLIPGFADRYKVIVNDRRGFGGSDTSILLEHLGITDKLYIIGQCEGGVVGYHYAHQNPDRVTAIATSSTLCSGKLITWERPEGETTPSFENADVEFQEKLIEWHGAGWAKGLYTLFYEMGGAYSTDPASFDLTHLLANIQCPSLVLYPDRSSLFDVEQGVLTYRSLPDGELAVLPHCGHNTYEQQPEEYRRIIFSFFERHRS